MTPPSSTSSSKTLRATFWPGRAAALALVLVALAEFGARRLAPNIRLEESVASFDLWADHLARDVNARRPEIWLIGNSTLHYGVDAGRMQSEGGASVMALPFGSGTLAGETAMLDYFLRRTRARPRQVVFFLTKDDLNSGGLRADVSRTYLKYGTWRGIDMGRLFRLDDIRKTLLNRLRTAEGTVESPSTFEGHLTAGASRYLSELIGRFSFDVSAFPRLEELAKEKGIRITLCLMPVTDVYVDFHDRHVPEISSGDMIRQMAALCERHGLGFHDFTAWAPRQYDWYRDPYHLNEAGREAFTRQVADLLGGDGP
jgi:hypothetical protein